MREPREAIRIESDRDFEERTELFAIFTSETKNQGIHPTIRPSQTKISILGSAYFLVPLHTNSLLLPTGTVIRPQELQVTGTHRRERRHPYHQTHSIGPASRRTFLEFCGGNGRYALRSRITLDSFVIVFDLPTPHLFSFFPRKKISFLTCCDREQILLGIFCFYFFPRAVRLVVHT